MTSIVYYINYTYNCKIKYNLGVPSQKLMQSFCLVSHKLSYNWVNYISIASHECCFTNLRYSSNLAIKLTIFLFLKILWNFDSDFVSNFLSPTRPSPFFLRIFKGFHKSEFTLSKLLFAYLYIYFLVLLQISSYINFF